MRETTVDEWIQALEHTLKEIRRDYGGLSSEGNPRGGEAIPRTLRIKHYCGTEHCETCDALILLVPLGD